MSTRCYAAAVTCFGALACSAPASSDTSSTPEAAADAAPAAEAAPAEPAEAEWIALFNGQNLDGWKIKFAGEDLGVNYKNTFRVENGVMRAVYDEYEKFDGKFGHIFYETPYANYRLRVEYRFTGEQTPGAPGWAFRNSGIMIHGQTPESMGKEQPFPASVEVQLLGGNGKDERPTANMCSPGTHVVMNGKLEKEHCIDSTAKTYHGDEWVTVEVEVRGGESIRHFVEGQEVISYSQPQLDPTDEETDAKSLVDQGVEKMLESGTISLQAESHPIEFRKVELQLL